MRVMRDIKIIGKEEIQNLKVKQSISMHLDKKYLLATTGKLDSNRRNSANRKLKLTAR